MNILFVWKGCSRVRVWSRRPCNKFFGSSMIFSSAWMHLAQCDPGLEAEKPISRTVGFCRMSPQRAGVEELTLAVCLLPELGFAAVMSGGGAAETKTWLPHASHCTHSSHVWYPEQLWVQGTPQGREAGFPKSSVSSQFHWLQTYVTFLHQHRFCPPDLAEHLWVFLKEKRQDLDKIPTMQWLEMAFKVLTSFLFREIAFGSIDPSDRFGSTKLSTFAAKTCGRGKEAVKEPVRGREGT